MSHCDPRLDTVGMTACSRGLRFETYDGAVLPGDRLSYQDGRAMTCIAMHDPVRRRGLWFRVLRNDVGEPIAVRLFAGREGDDDRVTIGERYPFDSRRLNALIGVLSSARWAYELGHPHSDDGDNQRDEARLSPNEGGWCAEVETMCGCASPLLTWFRDWSICPHPFTWQDSCEVPS